jgi:hypothetical protein
MTERRRAIVSFIHRLPVHESRKRLSSAYRILLSGFEKRLWRESAVAQSPNYSTVLWVTGEGRYV